MDKYRPNWNAYLPTGAALANQILNHVWKCLQIANYLFTIDFYFINTIWYSNLLRKFCHFHFITGEWILLSHFIVSNYQSTKQAKILKYPTNVWLLSVISMIASHCRKKYFHQCQKVAQVCTSRRICLCKYQGSRMVRLNVNEQKMICYLTGYTGITLLFPHSKKKCVVGANCPV